MSVTGGTIRILNKPMETIQAIIAGACFLFGVYVISPLYASGENSSISIVFDNSTVSREVIGFLFFFLPSLPTILGLFIERFRTPKWRARSAFCMFIGILFLTSLRIVTIGLTPLIWVFYLSLGLISAVLYLHWKDGDL